MALGNADRLLRGLGLLMSLLVVGVSAADETPKPEWVEDSKKKVLTAQLVNQAKSEETCDVKRISCGLGVKSSLLTTDCALDDGTFIDFWVFDGTIGDMVTVEMKSLIFDTFLFLLDPIPAVVAVDDDSGDGTNSLIAFALGETGEWTIAVNNLLPLSGDPGTYTLELSCGPVRVEQHD